MPKEGWAIPPTVETWKYHYFRNGIRNFKYGDLNLITKALRSRKYIKLIKVAEKYGNHLKYSLEQHVHHLLSEVEEFKEAYRQNDREKMIEELVDISNMCDLIYDKIRKETTKNEAR